MLDASQSTFQPFSVSVRSKSFWRIFDGFHGFSNANNSERAEASPLKLRLLRGSSRRYEPAKSQLSRLNSKTVRFELSSSTISPRVGVRRPDFDRSSMRSHCYKLWRRKLERLIFGRPTSYSAVGRSENPTKRGRGRGP
jgi:hypothetical protein